MADSLFIILQYTIYPHEGYDLLTVKVTTHCGGVLIGVHILTLTRAEWEAIRGGNE